LRERGLQDVGQVIWTSVLHPGGAAEVGDDLIHAGLDVL
jgi:hypothetical protein